MHHHKKNTRVEGAVPCGNPKRYGSRDVVHMPPFGSRDRERKSSHEGDDGTATESEKHMQTLLNRQIKTDVTLSEHFSQHRTFSLATSHDPGVEKLNGVRNYEKFKAVNDLDARIDYLRHCGLDDEEITLRLREEMKDKVPITTGGFGPDPQIQVQKLKEIERKIQEKEKSLKIPDTFKGALELSRQALELEKSLCQRQGKESSLTDIVTIQKKFDITHPDDPVNHIQEMLCDIEGKKERDPRKERRRRRKLERKRLYYVAFCGDADADTDNQVAGSRGISMSDHEDGDLNQCSVSLKNYVESPEGFSLEQRVPKAKAPEDSAGERVSCNASQESHSQNHFGPFPSCDKHAKLSVLTSDNEPRKLSSESKTCVAAESTNTMKTISTPIQLISQDEILRHRLSLEEIRAIDKFQNYTEGEPNKVVYVKNLPAKTTEEDLVQLFGSFQSEGKPRIVFKLLSGRMKGQAFITFPDEVTATKAVKLVNGYLFQDRPIILSFGKKQGS